MASADVQEQVVLASLRREAGDAPSTREEGESDADAAEVDEEATMLKVLHGCST